MTEPLGPPDATRIDAEELLRGWFQWFCTDPAAPTQLPDGLHIQTAAFLAARAVQDGRKIYGPRSL
jgi:hypothetical protein